MAVCHMPSPQHTSNDPFEFTEVDTPPGTKGKGKRPPDQNGEKGGARPLTKKPKKGVCRLHNTAAGGCPYGRVHLHLLIRRSDISPRIIVIRTIIVNFIHV